MTIPRWNDDNRFFFMHACLCLLFPPPVSDNELHDRLLKDKQRDGINQIGQCGSGTFPCRVFGKLQSKVNSWNLPSRKKRDRRVSGDTWLRNRGVVQQVLSSFTPWTCKDLDLQMLFVKRGIIISFFFFTSAQLQRLRLMRSSEGIADSAFSCSCIRTW